MFADVLAVLGGGCLVLAGFAVAVPVGLAVGGGLLLVAAWTVSR